MCLLIFLQIVPLLFQRPMMIALPKYGIKFFYPNQTTNQVYTMTMIAIDILVDFYVTICLNQILRKFIKNAVQISSNTSLFTAVMMFWSFLRFFVSLVNQISLLLFYLI